MPRLELGAIEKLLKKSRKEVLQNQIGAAGILLAVTALPRKSLFFSAGTSLLYTLSNGGT